MHLVEVFLPLTYPNGDPIPEAIFELIEAELTETFGGVTEYARGSARGLWRKNDEVSVDTLVVLEILSKDMDKDWWKDFRQRTQSLFRQEELLIRGAFVERL